MELNRAGLVKALGGILLPTDFFPQNQPPVMKVVCGDDALSQVGHALL